MERKFYVLVAVFLGLIVCASIAGAESRTVVLSDDKWESDQKSTVKQLVSSQQSSSTVVVPDLKWQPAAPKNTSNFNGWRRENPESPPVYITDKADIPADLPEPPATKAATEDLIFE